MSLMTLQLSLCVLVVIQVMPSQCTFTVGPVAQRPGFKPCCRRIGHMLHTLMRKINQLQTVVSELQGDVGKLNAKGELKKPHKYTVSLAFNP